MKVLIRSLPISLLTAASFLGPATSHADPNVPHESHETPPAHEGRGCAITEFVESPHSLAIDAVSRRAPSRDGQVDGVFDVAVTGEVTALILLTVDPNGRALGSQWDTIHVPQSIGARHDSDTWVIGVEERGRLLNLPDGRIPLLSGPRRFKLYVSNDGSLRTGVSFRLYAVGSDGEVAMSPILDYKTQ
jgi:hypothetical protein